MSESFAELFAESLETTNLRVGAIVIGTVVSVDRDFVTVNAGSRLVSSWIKKVILRLQKVTR